MVALDLAARDLVVVDAQVGNDQPSRAKLADCVVVV
jgi:hypothetical protein